MSETIDPSATDFGDGTCTRCRSEPDGGAASDGRARRLVKPGQNRRYAVGGSATHKVARPHSYSAGSVLGVKDLDLRTRWRERRLPISERCLRRGNGSDRRARQARLLGYQLTQEFESLCRRLVSELIDTFSGCRPADKAGAQDQGLEQDLRRPLKTIGIVVDFSAFGCECAPAKRGSTATLRRTKPVRGAGRRSISLSARRTLHRHVLPSRFRRRSLQGLGKRRRRSPTTSGDEQGGVRGARLHPHRRLLRAPRAGRTHAATEQSWSSRRQVRHDPFVPSRCRRRQDSVGGHGGGLRRGRPAGRRDQAVLWTDLKSV